MLSAQKDEKENILKQPRIYVIYGEDSNFTYYVTIADIKLFGTHIREMIELSFYFYWALNIEYPEECNQIWMFFQTTIFKLSVNSVRINSSVQELIKKLGI